MIRRLRCLALALSLIVALVAPNSAVLATPANPNPPQPQTTPSSSISLKDSAGWQPTSIPLLYDPHATPNRVEPLRPAGLSPQGASFIIDFVPAGSQNGLKNSLGVGDICMAFPEQAKAAFIDAGLKWGALLTSTVPIRIEACWTTLPSGVLGHSGALDYEYNFTGAPQSNTWFPVALANSLAGQDLDPASQCAIASNCDDISIAYANGYLGSFYFGTDGNAQGKIDFESVVMHEMGHGLGFSGSMTATPSTSGYTGSHPSIPDMFDTFAVDNNGVSLLNLSAYPRGSKALGSILTSGNVFLNSPNSRTANGGFPVPLYTPATWQGGSSYSHLAESFNGTVNAMMTYSIGNNEILHDPGPVVLGFFKDIGWTLPSTIPLAPSSLSATAISSTQINLTWTDNSANETAFNIQRAASDLNWATLGTAAAVSGSGGSGSYISTGLSEVTLYNYRVCAANGSACSAYSNTATATTLPAAPTNFTAAGTSLTQIHVSWVDQSAHETGFKVSRAPYGTTNWTNLSDVAASTGTGATLGFTDSGLTEASPYTYKICAMGTLACSAAVITQGAAMLVAPTLIGATPILWNRIDVSWTDNSTKETGYEIQRSPNGVDGWMTIATYTPGAGSSTGTRTYQDHNGVISEVHYRVRAVTALAISAWSTGPGVATIPPPYQFFTPLIGE